MLLYKIQIITAGIVQQYDEFITGKYPLEAFLANPYNASTHDS